MRKRLKKLCVSLILGVALLNSSGVAMHNSISVVEAASHKNPAIWGMKGEVQFDIHYGHKVKTVKIDGKTISKSKLIDYGTVMTPGGGCKTNCGVKNYGVKASKGTHKVEVYDNKGYWTISYVTVK